MKDKLAKPRCPFCLQHLGARSEWSSGWTHLGCQSVPDLVIWSDLQPRVLYDSLLDVAEEGGGVPRRVEPVPGTLGSADGLPLATR